MMEGNYSFDPLIFHPHNVIRTILLCGLTGVRLQLAVPPLVSIKGELGEAGCYGGLWHSGYGGYSQTPWVRVPQLLVFLFSTFSPSRLSSIQ